MTKKTTKPIRKQSPAVSINKLYCNIKQIIDEGKNNAYRAINFAMVQSYWHIGKLIIEEEQSGQYRAEYGEEVIKQLSNRLTKTYGGGFNERNLWYMKQFFQT